MKSLIQSHETNEKHSIANIALKQRIIPHLKNKMSRTLALLIESLVFIHSATSSCGLTVRGAPGPLLEAWVRQTDKVSILMEIVLEHGRHRANELFKYTPRSGCAGTVRNPWGAMLWVVWSGKAGPSEGCRSHIGQEWGRMWRQEEQQMQRS